MGYEDDHTVDSSDSTLEDRRGEPRSYPRTEGEEALEMRNLEPSSSLRSTSPMDGVRRRLSRDPEARKERERIAEEKRNRREVPVAVVEQRVSNLAQGCLCEFTQFSLQGRERHGCADLTRFGAHDGSVPDCFGAHPKRCPCWSFRMSNSPCSKISPSCRRTCGK